MSNLVRFLFQYALRNSLIYFETSCKTGENVFELFEQIASNLVRHFNPKCVSHLLFDNFKTQTNDKFLFLSAHRSSTENRKFCISLRSNVAEKRTIDHAIDVSFGSKEKTFLFIFIIRFDRFRSTVVLFSLLLLLVEKLNVGLGKISLKFFIRIFFG